MNSHHEGEAGRPNDADTGDVAMSVVISGPIDPELDGQLRQFLARLAEKKAAGELPDIEIIDNGVREG